MAKLPHLSNMENCCYFITTTTENRSQLFGLEQNAAILWNTIRTQRDRRRFHLLGFVIMPDHLHLLILPTGQTEVPFIMQEIKKSSARLINMAGSRTGRLWMDEYYDYVIRNEKDLMEKLRSVHNNPVKKGLAENEEDYPFSSANPIYNEFLFREF